jgi:tetratricopeptide (TPR) repeat protein
MLQRALPTADDGVELRARKAHTEGEIRLVRIRSLVLVFVWLSVFDSVAAVDPGQTLDDRPLAVATATSIEASDDDPWLAEKGPAVPAPALGQPAHEIVRHSWQTSAPTPRARAAALLRARLEFGLGDLTAPAIALLQDPPAGKPGVSAQLAQSLAPGVPAIQVAAARSYWAAGETGSAISSWVDAWMALYRDLGARTWLLGNLSILLWAVALGGSFAFIALAALRVFPHAAHDLGDVFSIRTPGFARTAALAALLLGPLALGEGLLGLALALFVLGFVYGTAQQRSVLGLAAVLLVIGLHPIAQLVSVTNRIVDRDPIARSATAVLHGIESRADVERLRAAEEEDLLAAHAMAYFSRRRGLDEEALRRVDSIIERSPTDPVALTNRGNLALRHGRTEEAIGYYQRAQAVLDSAVVLFDLSRAYGQTFRIEEQERTLARAQSLDDDLVAKLLGFEQPDLVADLEVPESLFIDRFRALALEEGSSQGITEALAPGRLGQSGLASAGAFVLAALGGLLCAGRWDHASRCRRCGDRICGRCEETVWSEELCEDCHHLFQNPGGTDPTLRRKRMETLARRESRLGRLVLLGSLIVPGVAGMAARRPDLSMFGLLLFGWFLGWVIWPAGVFVDPLRMGGMSFACLAVPGILSGLAYVSVVFASLVARRRL